MKDTLRDECDESEECLENCCINQVEPFECYNSLIVYPKIFAPLYFVVFVLLAQFVLVNVVVAVLMKHLEETHKQVCTSWCKRIHSIYSYAILG